MSDAKSIIEYIRTAKKRTPVKAYIGLKTGIRSETHIVAKNWLILQLKNTCRVFDCGNTLIVFGELEDIEDAIDQMAEYGSEDQSAGSVQTSSESTGTRMNMPVKIIDFVEIETEARNSAIPLLDISKLDARIEPGAVIRGNVKIGKQAVIMMGAIINIGAEVGARTMIDMGAVLGGRVIVGADCHIGAGCVLAGVIEPESAEPVVIEDGVFIGANAVVIEGCRIGAKSVIGAGAVVTSDIPPHSLVVGAPGRVVRTLEGSKTAVNEIIKELREI